MRRNSGPAAKKSNIWYAVHFLLVAEHVKPRKGGPRYLVYENVYLVRARTPIEARRKGEAVGKREMIEDPTLRWNGSPAQFTYGVIRKVVSCAASVDRRGDGRVRVVRDGDEATYSVVVVRDRSSLQRLMRGKPVEVTYEG